MKLGTIKVAACAASMMLAGALAGCSAMEKIGLGQQTANASEQAAANTIDAQTASQTGAANDSGAGRQIGQAAGQEMFKKVPLIGNSLGGAVGSGVEKGVRGGNKQPAQPAQQPAPVQPVAQPAPVPAPSN